MMVIGVGQEKENDVLMVWEGGPVASLTACETLSNLLRLVH